MLLAALVVSTLAAAPPAKSPAPGEYVLEGGNGVLTIDRQGTFKLDVLGGNAHTCHLEGKVSGATGTVPEDPCVVGFDVAADGVAVKAKEAEACRSWCGARAWFEGRYLVPPARCTTARVKASRDAFKRHDERKAWAEAKAELQPVLEQCERFIFRLELAWIRNDLAATLHRLGDGAGCARVLDPLRELAAAPDDELGAGEPSFRGEYLRLAKATRTNLKLCGQKP